MRRLFCWLFGHSPVITGRLHTADGVYRTMVCMDCRQHWMEPIPSNIVSH
jgi:hypothetical protein